MKKTAPLTILLLLGLSGLAEAQEKKPTPYPAMAPVCFVERSWAAGFDDSDFWNPRLRAPNCFNPPAVRSVLPQYLRRTEWALAGHGRTQMIEEARAAVASGLITAPEGRWSDGSPAPPPASQHQHNP